MSLKKSVINKMAVKSNADFIRSLIIHLIRKYIAIPEAEMIKNDIAIS
jgi:hypothetical protein